MYVTDEGVAGGDGCQYPYYPQADGQKWNDNPILQTPDPYTAASFPMIVVGKRKK
jgi:hypothetical protein